jgi:hypothetical protein
MTAEQWQARWVDPRPVRYRSAGAANSPYHRRKGTYMQIALALYPKFALLDIVGPYQVFGQVPGDEVLFVSRNAGK